MTKHQVDEKEARRIIPPALALAALAVLLAIGFFWISRAVAAGRMENLDERLLLAMRESDDLSDPVGPKWVEEVGRDFTSLGGVAVLTLITCIATAFFWLASMHHGAVYIAAASVTAMLLSSTLKGVFDRPRPDLVPHEAAVYSSSFPSGHSTMAAAVYLTLALVASRFVPRRRVKALFLVAAIFVTGAVGVSRVYLGVHWPSDVLAGWAIGAAWALLCWCAAVWLQAHGMIEQEEDLTAKSEN
jgi:undecaprenyl-diphosphatase